jgi:putative toxin-antitoxin system antitoxin component (TIGR02293 family)
MSSVSTRKKPSSSVASKYVKYFDNPITVLSAAKKGLKAESVFDFITLSGISSARIETVLNRSLKTFQNYRESETPLDPTTSEKLLLLFALYHRGSVVFGNSDELAKWMSEPSFGLGNQLPLDLLDTITGIRLVDDELARIEYGDLA